MTIGDIEKLQEALALWERIDASKDRFIEANTNADGDVPFERFGHYDEGIADFNEDLVDAGERLVAAIREVIG